MATYKVQAPDGKTITLEGPDGASQDDVIAQAQQLYKPAPKAAAPKAPPTRTEAKTAWDQGSALLEQKIAGLPVAAQKIARDRFFADPRIKALREQSARPVSEAKREGRIAVSKTPEARAKRTKAQRNFLGLLGPIAAPTLALDDDTLAAGGAGFIRGGFGLPERAAAGVEYLVNNPDGDNYSNILETTRGMVNADRERSLAGDLAGQVGAGIPLGNAMGMALQLPKVAPIVATAMNVAPKATKAATWVGGGALGGAAQSAGEGSDVATGTAFGAGGGAALMGLGKSAAWLLRPVADLVKSPAAGKILQRFTKATTEDMAAEAARIRAETGAEPTLFEILPLEDRNRLSQQIIKRSPAASEQAATAANARVTNMGPEMAASVENATGGRRQAAVGQFVDDMQAAGSPDAAPLPGLARAAQSPLDMEGLRRVEASTTMAPVEQMHVADDLEALFPQAPRLAENGDVEYVFADPELNSMISRAAGSLRLRPTAGDPTAEVAGLSVNDVTRIIDKLGDVPPASPDFLTSQRAVNHLIDSLPPEARELTEQMRAAYAARSRMMEGMSEGARTRTRESVPVDSRGKAQTVGNAYDTPEGAEGRFLGQSNTLNRDFGGTPQDVLRRMVGIAEGGETQAALRGNLGADAADAISGAARTQAESARRLASIGRESSQEADSLGADDLGRMILALNPASMPTTKLFALSRIMQLTRLPEKKARAVIDMLFSQDPAITNRAIGLLNNAGQQGRAFVSDLSKSLNIGARTGQAGQLVAGSEDMLDPLDAIPEANAAEVPSEEIVEEEIPEEAPEETDVPYGRSVIEELFPEAHITSDHRGPDNAIYDPNSGHAGYNTVDIRPIPGMTFDEFLQTIEEEGYEIVNAYDESKRPADPRKAKAWGPHWHVEIG